MIDQILSDPHFRHYVFINLGVATGIAIDAMIATLSRFSSFPNGRAVLKWGGAIGLTHWLFPLAGFIGGWYAAINVPLSTLVFLFGASVMAWFVTQVVKSSAGLSNVDDGSSLSRIWTSRVHFWAAVWAVSIDALITGPGKTSATAGWSELEVWLSFPIVGIVVFLLVIAAAGMSKLLYHRYSGSSESPETPLKPNLARYERDRSRLGVFFVFGAWFEICIFSYFGLLAVAQTFRLYDLPVPGLLVVGATAALGLGLFWFLHDKVRETQFRRVELAFGK